MALTDRKEMFCNEFVVDYNAASAARRAGYSAKTSAASACRLMLEQEIIDRIAELKSEVIKRTKADADWCINVTVDTIERCRQAEQVRDREGNHTGEWKFDAGNTLKGTEMLMKVNGMFKDTTTPGEGTKVFVSYRDIKELRKTAKEKK